MRHLEHDLGPIEKQVASENDTEALTLESSSLCTVLYMNVRPDTEKRIRQRGPALKPTVYYLVSN